MAATEPIYLRPSPSGESIARLLEQLPLADRPAVDAAVAIGPEFLVAVSALLSGGRGPDAAAILGQTLSRRAAVWWACRAARSEPRLTDPRMGPEGVALPQPEVAALEAAEAWVRSPGQALARAAESAARHAAGTPAGCAALAAFLAGESLSPPEAPVVPPPEHLAGLAAVGAVRLAAVRHQPELEAETLRRLIEDGVALTAGTGSWEGTPQPADAPRARAGQGNS